MSQFDLIVRESTLVTPAGPGVADIGISDGIIAAIEPELEGSVAEEILGEGLHCFPGAIDAHVHFNEPGRGDWEGWLTGSSALAVGGATSCLEMPLNALPPTIDPGSWHAKVEVASANSHVDFGLWAGLTPDSLPYLRELAEFGAIGFKAFMSRTGTPEFRNADDETLLAGMRIAAEVGVPVAVHAEDDALTARLAAEAVAAGRLTARDYLDSRPVEAETDVIARAIALADEAGCALHIVHVSSGAGVALVTSARARGQDVTCETCPHYLLFTEDDVIRIGAALKCAPPIRAEGERDLLWRELAGGGIDFVASDHSPCPPEMKLGDDWFAIWGGVAGAQSTLATVAGVGSTARGMSLARIADVLSGAVARRFRLAGKGRIVVGAYADLALVDLAAAYRLSREDLRDRHRANPYAGMTLHARPERVLLRGRTIAIRNTITGTPSGRLLRPAANVAIQP